MQDMSETIREYERSLCLLEGRIRELSLQLCLLEKQKIQPGLHELRQRRYRLYRQTWDLQDALRAMREYVQTHALTKSA